MKPSTSLGTMSNVGMVNPSPLVRQAGNIRGLLRIHEVCRRNILSSGSHVKDRCRCRVTQYHSDIAHMTQTQAGAIRPKSLAAFPALSGNPGALIILVRHMSYEIFERFILHGLPGPGERKDKAPAACGISLVAVLDHAYVG